MPKIKKHTGVQCPKCKDKIFSEYRHDLKYCSCGYLFVDGGYDYLRFGVKDLSIIKEVTRGYDAKKNN